MGEVRRYFCCTDNITGCKILGSIQLALTGICLLLAIVALSGAVSHDDRRVLTEEVIVFGLSLLFPIFLVVGAAKRNSCLLMTCIILNALSLLFYAYAVFTSAGAVIFQNLVALGIGIWVELVAIGGYQEVKNPA